MTHDDAWWRKWRGNWGLEWVASTLHTTSEHGVFSITSADAHTSAASSRLNWRPCRFKWTRPFHRKTKSGFCACAITFQTQSTSLQISEIVLYGTDHVLKFEKFKLWTRSLVKLQSILLKSLSLLYRFFSFTYVKLCKLCFHFEIQIYQFYKSTILFVSKPKQYEEAFIVAPCILKSI